MSKKSSNFLGSIISFICSIGFLIFIVYACTGDAVQDLVLEIEKRGGFKQIIEDILEGTPEKPVDVEEALRHIKDNNEEIKETKPPKEKQKDAVWH